MIEAIIFDWVGTLYQFRDKGIDQGLFSYSEKVLKKLQQKYKLAVISKAVSDDVETRKQQINAIKRYFDVITVDIDKTPEQYLECMGRLNTLPSNTLIVDDRSVRGIKIGNNLGCKTAWIRNGKYADEMPNEATGNPTYVIDSIKDLLSIL